MRLQPVRFRTRRTDHRWTALLAAAVVSATACGDRPVSAPRSVDQSRALLAVRPAFAIGPSGGPAVLLSRIRGVLIGPRGDSTVASAAFTGDSAVLVFNVQITGSSAKYTLDLTAFDPQDIVAYHAAQDVTVKPGDNANVAAPVLVYSAPDTALRALHVSPPALLLNAGASGSLTAIGSTASGQAIVPLRLGWTPRDPLIASVDGSGTVRAGAFQGSTWVVARTATNVADSARVTVHAPVDRVLVAPATVEIIRGSAGAVGAELRDAGNHLIDDRAATWSSSDPTVATVSPTGAVQALRIGTATLTATAEGKSATATVNVVSPVARVEIIPASLSFASLHETQAVVTHVVARPNASIDGLTAVFNSSNAAVATVDATGNVTASGNGTASITATVDGVSGSATATVQQVAASIAISPKDAAAHALGETCAFSATVLDALGGTMTAPALTWTSSNTGVATVGSDGVAKAIGSGIANITVTAAGKSDVARFSVSQIQALLLLFTDHTRIQVGDGATLTAKVADANGNPLFPITPTWTTLTPAIASVTPTGRVTALSAGTATLSAAANGLTASLSIIVVANPNAPSGGAVSGQVINAVTGSGIAGATVTTAANTIATTAADGSFTLQGVANGSSLTIAAAGFTSTQYFNAATSTGTTQPLGVLPLVPSSTSVGSFSGRVIDARSGNGVPNALLSARPGINATVGDATQVFTDQSGNYSGSLPAGTYTVTATSAGYSSATGVVPAIGGFTLANQNIVLSPAGLNSNSFRFILQWNATPRDLDSHLVGPTGNGGNFEIAYYSRTFSDSSGLVAQLDHDVTSGFGPETITLNKTVAGHYRYYVHRYCCGENFGTSGARVTVYRGSSVAAQFSIPSGDGEVWTVFDLDGTSGALTSINTLSPTYNIPTSGSGSFNVIPDRSGSDDIRALLERVRSHAKPSSGAGNYR